LLPKLVNGSRLSGKLRYLGFGKMQHRCNGIKITSSEVQAIGPGMDGHRYVDMLLKGPLKQATRSMCIHTRKEVFIVEDEAPRHTCNLAYQTTREVERNSLIYPSYIYRSNSIMSVWHLLKTKAPWFLIQVTTLHKLWKSVQAFWKDTGWAWANNLIKEVPERVKAVY
jgi:hypothetical protein